MRFLNPTALWWLALGAIILLFYFLKPRRKRVVVPSVLLWSRALSQLEASAPFKRLRRSLLLLLQLLALSALVFVLARPAFESHSTSSGTTVIVVDSTASMNSVDEDGRSRLEKARELADELISEMSSGARVALIETSNRATVRTSFTSDENELRNGLAQIRATDASGGINEALTLGAQLLKNEEDPELVVLSDGATDDSTVRSSTDTRHIPVRFIRLGTRSDNVGIVALNARNSETRRTREVFASIENASSRDREVVLDLRLDNRLIDSRNLVVPATGRSSLIFDSVPGAGGLVELRLQVEDDLGSDNVAFTWLEDLRPVVVGIASDDAFVLQALVSNPRFNLRRVSPGESLSNLDCIVIGQGNDPALVTGAMAVLAINPQDSSGLWNSNGSIEKPQINRVEQSHPVNQFLSFSDINIESSTKRSVADWLKPVVSANDDALIWAGRDDHRSIVLLGFDPKKSDLPLKIEFPILVSNAVDWLVQRQATSDRRSFRVGETITFPVDQSTSITSPDGEVVEIQSNQGVVTFSGATRAGLYQIGAARPFAASLLSRGETANAPRDLVSGAGETVAGQASGNLSEKESWRWIALIGLALLSAEWWVFHRRIS